MALEDPEYLIREHFIFELAKTFPHSLSNNLANLGKREGPKSWPIQGIRNPLDKVPQKTREVVGEPGKQSEQEAKSFQETKQKISDKGLNFWAELRLQLYQKIWHCCLNDTVYSVRQSAISQMKQHFSDLLQFYRSQLNWRQQRYLVESFDIGSAYHRKIAWEFLRQMQTSQENGEDSHNKGESTNDTEKKLLEIKLFHYLDLSGELLLLLSNCAQNAKKVGISFFEKQALKLAYCDRSNADEWEFAWSLQVLFRALELNHNRFLWFWFDKKQAFATG